MYTLEEDAIHRSEDLMSELEINKLQNQELSAAIVDDCMFSVIPVKCIMEGMGMKTQVVEAKPSTDTEDIALDIAETIKDVDIVLIDRHMPGISTERICRYLMDNFKHKEVSIVLISTGCDADPHEYVEQYFSGMGKICSSEVQESRSKAQELMLMLEKAAG